MQGLYQRNANDVDGDIHLNDDMGDAGDLRESRDGSVFNSIAWRRYAGVDIAVVYLRRGCCDVFRNGYELGRHRNLNTNYYPARVFFRRI